MTVLSLSEDQAQRIVREHLPGHSRSTVRFVKELLSDGYSYSPNMKNYIVDLSTDGSGLPVTYSCFILISDPSARLESEYPPHSFPVISSIVSQILKHTEVPIASPILDTSLSTVPYHFLLSPASPISSSDIIPLSVARRSGALSPKDLVLVDLQIGKLLGQLHNGVQNDWFGLPSLSEPADPSYSWQETFTSLLESLLSEVESKGVDLPYKEIRGYLSRAIGFFLFDDVDTPSLIWFTGSEDDIYVCLPSESGSKNTGEIAAILPNVGHAIWGDPLLESFFLPPSPSAAFQEGYLSSGGKPTIVFPRQKTKRLWYSLFLGLIILRERGGKGKSDTIVDESWALQLIQQSVKALSNAPCY